MKTCLVPHGVQCLAADGRALGLKVGKAHFDICIGEVGSLVHDRQVPCADDSNLEDAWHG